MLRGALSRTLSVGYSAHYALHVHENLQAYHPNGGQAKFLEQPMRQFRDQMIAMVVRAVKERRGMEAGLTEAGAFLKVESQALVPVDTGLLRASWFQEVT